MHEFRLSYPLFNVHNLFIFLISAHISLFSTATLTQIFFLSDGNILPLNQFFTCHHDRYHLSLARGHSTPLLVTVVFFGSLCVQLVEQTALAAVVTVPLLGFDDASLAQIPQGAADG